EERERDHKADHRAHPGGERAYGEVDPESDPVARLPAAEPVQNLMALRLPEQEEGEHGRRRGGGDDQCILDRPGSDVVESGRQRGGEQRDRHQQRRDPGHPEMSVISSGSTVPESRCASSASARISPITATLTTTSVRVSACTTGSTAVVP